MNRGQTAVRRQVSVLSGSRVLRQVVCTGKDRQNKKPICNPFLNSCNLEERKGSKDEQHLKVHITAGCAVGLLGQLG